MSKSNTKISDETKKRFCETFNKPSSLLHDFFGVKPSKESETKQKK